MINELRGEDLIAGEKKRDAYVIELDSIIMNN